MRRRNLLWLPASMLLMSCAGTTNLHVLEKPDIAVPPQAKKIAVIDRCSFYTQIARAHWTGQEQNKGLAYNYGVLDCIQSFAEYWQQRGVADSVFVPYGIELKGMEKLHEIPKRMSAEDVRNLCKRFKADALVVLESYSSDFSVTYSRPYVVPQPQPIEYYPGQDYTSDLVYPGYVPPPPPPPLSVEEEVDMRLRPNSYTVPSYPQYGNFKTVSVWRIYDATGENVLSELHLDNSMSIGVYPASGGFWPNEKQMREQTGASVGRSSAQYVESQWKAVARPYYTSGSRAIRKGAKLAKQSNWQAAASHWNAIAEKNRRGAGKACFNLAVAAEKQGSIQLAQEWAKKADEKGCKYAAKYLADLERVMAVAR